MSAGKIDIKFDFKELDKYADKINEMAGPKKVQKMLLSNTNALAGMFETRVKKLTPVGTYDDTTGKGSSGVARVGGVLRRSWKVEPAKVRHKEISSTVHNNVPYAIYVNYGHRQEPGRYVPAIGKRLKARWVDGQFFKEAAEKDSTKYDIPLVEQNIHKWLEEVFRDD